MALCSFTSIVSSRAGGHHFLSSRPTDPTKAPSRQPTNNGSIHANAASFATSWPLPRKLKLVPSISTAKPPKSSAPLSSKWAIPNRQRLSKPTIPLPTALSTHPFANGDRVQWTCDSIGYATASAKTISSSTGNPVGKTSVTTSPSITRRPTIKPCAPHISLKPLFALQIALQVVCEGVLILA